jgi:PAS domain S-box-containing protein
VVAAQQAVRHDAAGVPRLAIPALVLALGIVGYLTTSQTIQGDRDAAAGRAAQVLSVRVQGVLARAGAVTDGLGNALADEPSARQRRFARLADAIAGSTGLPDALWVESVPRSERRSYERRIGAPITRLTASGSTRRAGTAQSYLPATYTSQTRPELRAGVDVSTWPALAASIRDRTRIFAVSASRRGALGDQPGFYLVRAGTFAGRRGYVAVFAPRGWLTVALAEDPRRAAISLDGRRLDGGLETGAAAGDGFEALARRWSVDVGSEPLTGLQELLPWFALTWPAAVALLVVVVGRGVMRRRRAERDLERFFTLSLELLCVAGFDGYFKRVNPAFERTLGYSSEELLSRPYAEFVHPEDRLSTERAVGELSRGREIIEFENRYLRKDGSVRWLQWSTRPMPDEGVMYAAARDITDRRQLAAEQAALRRVATLVAQGRSANDVFSSAVSELQAVVGADATAVVRYESDGAVTLLAAAGTSGFDSGHRMRMDGFSVSTEVRRTRATVRIDDYSNTSGAAAEQLRASGVRSGVGAPIIVESRLWGVMVGAWKAGAPPADVEDRVEQFTDLVATAIANAESRAQLMASRARIVATADDTRRRIERDLHDGAQQRLVALALRLRALEASIPPGEEAIEQDVAEVAAGIDGVLDDLREASRGLHPVILSRGGLKPALKTLARRSPVPVELDVQTEVRLPASVEVAAYYVVAETLTNTAKHAHASVVHVAAEALDGSLRVSVRDDGVGGADPTRGSGLVGLADRVEALGGTLCMESPPGGGTSLRIELPLDPASSDHL